MIIETNTDLYRAIRASWLAQQPSDSSIHYHKIQFIRCLEENKAHRISNRRLQSRNKFQFEDVLGVIYGADYIKFESEKDYVMFLLKYL